MWTWSQQLESGKREGGVRHQDTAAAGRVPGARSGAVSWTDGASNFWLFGGSGYGIRPLAIARSTACGATVQHELVDLDGRLESGNSTGVYGTQGTAAAGSVPGARSSAVSWIDSAGNLWMFSGYPGATQSATRACSTICGATVRARTCGPGWADRRLKGRQVCTAPKALRRPAIFPVRVGSHHPRRKWSRQSLAVRRRRPGRSQRLLWKYVPPGP